MVSLTSSSKMMEIVLQTSLYDSNSHDKCLSFEWDDKHNGLKNVNPVSKPNESQTKTNSVLRCSVHFLILLLIYLFVFF
jgi:hypothetical protein